MLQRRQMLLASGMSAMGAWGAAGMPVPAHAAGDKTGGDPLGSLQWPTLREQYLENAPVRFTDEVIVRTPAFADDAMNVPLQVDARALSAKGGGVQRIFVVVDRNPVREVLDFEPLQALPMLSFRIRLEQASPVRAMVRTRDGQWHVGSVQAHAAGGGCTVPGASRADGSWKTTLNQVQARIFNNVIDGSRRLRVRVMHPMDTGLVAGIPAFYIEQLELQDASGQAWWKLGLYQPVSENPLITFELPRQGPQEFRLQGRDNNGNPIQAEVRA
ncbi:quinoprotein dehydrogenase-associated SoxYZ-like carrier [Comamonas composti]|uniref:quinoprotein dehydrogenase-associated SoxYZ-like carrier n=1 Tax=Comamonas composti TaxID=408558 RepID=UPI0004125AB7|nr:quinoprotein dehydrogenase-associated SoxYZ-like carrier [Comamonas composti]